MRELSQGSREGVVFAVVGGVLEVVARADGVFAVVVFGFVVVEVDLAEEFPLVMLELADHFGVFWFILMRSGYSAPEHQHELYNVSNVFEREEPRKEKENTESMEEKG